MTMIGAPSTDAIVNRCDFTPDFPPPDNSNEFALPTVVLLKLKLKWSPPHPPSVFAFLEVIKR